MKICLKRLCCLSIFYSQVLFSTTLYAQSFYKWIDKNGSTHYTKTPPPKNSKNLGQVETYGYRTSTTTPTDASSESVTQITTPEILPIHSTAKETPTVQKDMKSQETHQKQSSLL